MQQTFKSMGMNIEPMLLLDVTGSMGWPAKDGSTITRRDVVREALNIVVERLAAEDAQAGKPGDEGGLRTILFSTSLPNGAMDIEDLNPDNLVTKWGRIPWGGGTRIMPGFQLVLSTYTHEFPGTEKPMLVALVVTDGAADDISQFETLVAKSAGSMYVGVAVVGSGTDSIKAYDHFNTISGGNPHVRAVNLTDTTNPDDIANALMGMLA